MNANLFKIAAVISFLIGILSVFAGSMVILGKSMDYYVIDWLPGYNLILGLISAFFTAVIIWQGNPIAMPAAIATFASHSMVMLILQTSYRDVVAVESIRAMAFRMMVWLSILTLLIVQSLRSIPQS